MAIDINPQESAGGLSIVAERPVYAGKSAPFSGHGVWMA